jgi:opacity protein-like surface antigen
MKGGMIGVLAAAILLTPMAAAAQSYEDLSKGIYFELRGGGAYLTDSDIDASAAGLSASGEAEFDPGFAIEGAAGYEHSSGFRGEVAVGYRRNDIEDLSGGGTSCSSLGISCGGEVETVSIMANGYYAFNVEGKFKPFIGAGAGIARVDAELEVGIPGFGSAKASDDDTVFAYQGIAGVSYEINETLTLSGLYSYFATEDLSFGDSATGQLDAEYQSHNFMLGLRITR